MGFVLLLQQWEAWFCSLTTFTGTVLTWFLHGPAKRKPLLHNIRSCTREAQPVPAIRPGREKWSEFPHIDKTVTFMTEWNKQTCKQHAPKIKARVPKASEQQTISSEPHLRLCFPPPLPLLRFPATSADTTGRRQRHTPTLSCCPSPSAVRPHPAEQRVLFAGISEQICKCRLSKWISKTAQ